MQKVNVREARQNISRLLDAVEAGEKVIIMRRGKPVAKLLVVDKEDVELRFPDRINKEPLRPPRQAPSLYFSTSKGQQQI